jgi:hypothetical protein
MKNAYLLTLLLVLSGCIGSDEPFEAESAQPTFSGKPDATLAGVFKQEGADITMTLFPDGSLTTKGTVNARGRTLPVDGKGRWAVDGKHLFMEVESGSGKRVSRRSYDLKKDQLTLTSDVLPKPSVYTRITTEAPTNR